jgi:hypothetical protein
LYSLKTLSGFSHWDGLQVQNESDLIDQAIFTRNINATLINVIMALHLGYAKVLRTKVPESIIACSKKIVM